MAEKGNIFLRYIRLINLVSRHGHITFEEIGDEWMRLFGAELPRRTFVRHREAIADIFGIEIICRKSDNTYYIKTDGLNRDDDEVIRLANMMSANRLISDSQRLASRVIHEPVPSGERFLEPIIVAMKRSVAVELSYSAYGEEISRTRIVEPYCVKCFRQRWYLLSRRCDNGELRLYSLDRISDIRPTQNRFRMPADFDPVKFFSDIIGVTYYDIPDKQKIIIRASAEQRSYLVSLPIHHSQKEVGPGVFELRLRPGYDFIQELRRHADKIEVISPQWLRDRMRDDAVKVANIYK